MELTKLSKEFEQYRHESFMRDDRLDKRMDRLQTMQEEQWRTVQSIGEGLAVLGDKIVELVTAVNALTARMDQTDKRMDQTDKRWNQLIDMLAKQHKNGGQL